MRWSVPLLLFTACTAAPPAPLPLDPSPLASALPTEPEPPPAASSPAPAPPAEEPPPPPPPLGGARLRSLPVAGFGDAVVAVPTRATDPRPVLVATHGNYDKPDWQCQVWGQIVQDRGFVLCPRGVPRRDSPSPKDTRYEYASNPSLEQEIDAGLASLSAAFPGFVDNGPVVLAGFSLGAILAVAIATRRPERFPRLVLVEGGDGWTLQAARSFRKGGGQRVLFACSQGGCLASARVASGTLKKAALEVEIAKGKNEGHTYVGDVMERYAERFPWLTEGDERWR